MKIPTVEGLIVIGIIATMTGIGAILEYKTRKRKNVSRKQH